MSSPWAQADKAASVIMLLAVGRDGQEETKTQICVFVEMWVFLKKLTHKESHSRCSHVLGAINPQCAPGMQFWEHLTCLFLN